MSIGVAAPDAGRTPRGRLAAVCQVGRDLLAKIYPTSRDQRRRGFPPALDAVRKSLGDHSGVIATARPWEALTPFKRMCTEADHSRC